MNRKPDGADPREPDDGPVPQAEPGPRDEPGPQAEPGPQTRRPVPPAPGPAVPTQSSEDTDAGWGDYAEQGDDWLLRDRPPHWDR